MKNKHFFIFLLNLLFIIIISQEWLYSAQFHVKIKDPIYEYLNRLSIQGTLPSYMNTTLPLNRTYIAEMLIHLEENRDKLSTVDTKILD